MLKNKVGAILFSLTLAVSMIIPGRTVSAAGATYYDNKTGNEDGYDYELWKDRGNTSMTLNGNGEFSCSWSNINNALFRKGRKFDSTQTYQQIGNISIDYGVNYQPNGNSYLCVYGWMKNPLVEYYIVESWGTWRPPGTTSMGSITVDGGTYDVYQSDRINQPSIEGNTTFKQYWSVRRSKKTSGTITVSDHFRAWERMGLRMGKMYEVALNIEGYQSSGTADVYKNVIHIGGSSQPGGGQSSGGSSGGGNGSESGTVNTKPSGMTKECEDMTLGGSYAGRISSPFQGVALYGNQDSVKFTHDFKNGTNDFTLHGCSDGSNMARVDLLIGGVNKGTFYFGDNNPAYYTIKNVSHGTGSQEVKLVVSADDGSWDAYADQLIISGESTDSGQPGGQSGQEPSQGGGQQSGQGQSGGDTTIQCEDMTIDGPYAGKISSPFSGVALYGNSDEVSCTQDFGYDTHDFTLRGASSNNNMVRVDLMIGGENKGTFYFGDAYTAEYTIKNVRHKTGQQKIELIVNADDGNWDAYIDSLAISGAGGTAAASQSGQTNPGTSIAGRKVAALTFDDGPTSTTNDVLDVLARYDVPATFFLIGQQVNSSTMAIVQREVSMGCELACHSYTHQDMSKMSASQIRNEFEWCTSAIRNTVGVDVKFFRAPYLSESRTMFENTDLDFIQGITCNDWESYTSTQQRVNTVLSTVKDGDVILLHDFQGNVNTVNALPQIIEGLRDQGYTLVTVSDLFKAKGVNPDQEYKSWTNVLR